MNETLDKYLCETYPLIFAERKLSTQVSCMGRGLECGDGWFPIINQLCYQIQQRIDWDVFCPSKDREPISQVVFLQVKEKFGVLRIYHKGGDDFLNGMITMTEMFSYYICEVCGIGGPVMVGHTEGWIQSTCEKCAKKNKRPKVSFNTKVRNQMLKAEKQRKPYA